jgi:peptidoglycan/LPS O-acetylase OafA/YrhL
MRASLKNQAEHYFGLDLMRFTAAWFVVLDHFGLFGWKSPRAFAPPNEIAFPFLHRMTGIGSIGVEIFFLISGFVIAGSAIGQTPRHFALRRAIRVLPALWICSSLAFLFRASTGEPIPALGVAFLKSIILSPFGPYIDGVIWTLVVEAVFYALVVFCLFPRKPINFARLAQWLGIPSAAFIVLMFTAYILAPSLPIAGRILAICDRFPFKVMLLRHGVFFAVGILVWAYFHNRITRRQVVCLCLLLVPCSLEISIFRDASDAAICLGLWWASLGLLVASVARSDDLFRLMSPYARLIKDCGRISYPLYLSHFSIGLVIVPLVFRLHIRSWPALIVALAIVSVISYLVMRYPERVIQRYMNTLEAHLRSSRRTNPATLAAMANEPPNN